MLINTKQLKKFSIFPLAFTYKEVNVVKITETVLTCAVKHKKD